MFSTSLSAQLPSSGLRWPASRYVSYIAKCWQGFPFAHFSPCWLSLCSCLLSDLPHVATAKEKAALYTKESLKKEETLMCVSLSLMPVTFPLLFYISIYFLAPSQLWIMLLAGLVNQTSVILPLLRFSNCVKWIPVNLSGRVLGKNPLSWVAFLTQFLSSAIKITVNCA